MCEHMEGFREAERRIDDLMRELMAEGLVPGSALVAWKFTAELIDMERIEDGEDATSSLHLASPNLSLTMRLGMNAKEALALQHDALRSWEEDDE